MPNAAEIPCDAPSAIVVGAGVIGLTSAIRLREEGFNAHIVAAARAPHVTSDRAAAVFSPHRLSRDLRVIAWGRDAYGRFEEIARDQPDSGVAMLRLREYFYREQSIAPWWGAVVKDFRRISDRPPQYADAYEALVPRMDMGRFMPWLERRFTRDLGGTIETRSLSSLADLEGEGHRLVVNCTGLGARKLANDELVHPVRGQILHVANDIGLNECLLDERRGDTMAYVFPFERHIVLGGTYEVGEWTETTTEAALAGVLERCRALLRNCGVPRWEDLGKIVLARKAGLRPARGAGEDDACVRLDVESAPAGLRVIHNYGHGGAGVTLSWGCAEEVVRLARGARA